MKIGELAKLTGLATSRIRFYEASGLIRSQRKANGYRDYAADTVWILELVTGAQGAGLCRGGIARQEAGGAGAGREAQVVDHVDHAAGVDHPDRELFQVGRDAGEVRFGADGGERLAIDRLAIADVVNHAGFPEVGWEGRAAR